VAIVEELMLLIQDGVPQHAKGIGREEDRAGV
jgi:hypothetical protein